MRARNIRTAIVAALATGPLVLTATACGNGATTTPLGNVRAGKVGYIDAWDDCGRTGDQAEVELNQGNSWMVEKDVKFSSSRTGQYKVKVRRTRFGVDVLDMNNVRVGRDSDSSVSSDDLKVNMKAKGYKWESSFLGSKNCTTSHHGSTSTKKTPTAKATTGVKKDSGATKSTKKTPAPRSTKRSH